MCIAFDLSKVRPPTKHQSALTVGPCEYRENKKKLLLQDALRTFFVAVHQTSQQVDDPLWVGEQIRNLKAIGRAYGRARTTVEENLFVSEVVRRKVEYGAGVTLFDLLRVASHCKHPDFIDEQEWRIALPVAKVNSRQSVKYRGANSQIPYIGTDLFQAKLPITEVMVGPVCEEHKQVQELLDRHGHKAVITCSKIPRRDIANFFE